MRTLIVVPPEKLEEAQNIMANHVIGWESAGLEITHRKERMCRASNDDTVLIFDYPATMQQDVCGQTSDILMVHLDLVCLKNWRELEAGLIAVVIGAKGFTKVYRSGEFKVYAVEEE